MESAERQPVCLGFKRNVIVLAETARQCSSLSFFLLRTSCLTFRRTLDCGDSRRRLSYRHRVAGQLGNRPGRRTGEISNTVPHCIVVATVANTLGGMTSYGIGRFLPAKPEKSKALTWLHRYGEWMLLMSWVPLIGDALCVAAGWLRINPWLTLLMLAIGKCARYLAIAGGWAWVAAKWFA